MSQALKVAAVVFDVADTLLTKGDIPALFVQILEKHVRTLSPAEKSNLRQSYYLNKYETQFPDLTTADFYQEFNRRVLRSIEMDTAENIDLICHGIKQKPWFPFEDTKVLANLRKRYRLGILSNWDLSLGKRLRSIFPDLSFDPIVGSADVGIQKPHPGIFHRLIEAIGKNPDQILYIGDSPRLDFEPAKKVGLHSILIDRESIHKSVVPRITSLENLEELLCPN